MQKKFRVGLLLLGLSASALSHADLQSTCRAAIRATREIFTSSPKKYGYNAFLQHLATIDFFEEDSGLRLPQAKHDYYRFFTEGFKDLALRKKILSVSTGLEISVETLKGKPTLIFEKPAFKIASVTIPEYRKQVDGSNPVARGFLLHANPQNRVALESMLDLMHNEIYPDYVKHLEKSYAPLIADAKAKAKLFRDAEVEDLQFHFTLSQSGAPLLLTTMKGKHKAADGSEHVFTLSVTSVLDPQKGGDSSTLVYDGIGRRGTHRFYQAEGPPNSLQMPLFPGRNDAKLPSIEDLINRSHFDNTHDGI